MFYRAPGPEKLIDAAVSTDGHYPWAVSQVDRDRTTTAADELPRDERVWLNEQLAIYRELLAYLHDH